MWGILPGTGLSLRAPGSGQGRVAPDPLFINPASVSYVRFGSLAYEDEGEAVFFHSWRLRRALRIGAVRLLAPPTRASPGHKIPAPGGKRRAPPHPRNPGGPSVLPAFLPFPAGEAFVASFSSTWWQWPGPAGPSFRCRSEVVRKRRKVFDL